MGCFRFRCFKTNVLAVSHLWEKGSWGWGEKNVMGGGFFCRKMTGRKDELYTTTTTT